MPPESYLHQHPQFSDLLRIIANEKGIPPFLVEKDYWIMHCLHGLQYMRLLFELKGGTSLSKGYGIIDRFSEDIDIRIEPPSGMRVYTGRNHDSPTQCESRKNFYDWLTGNIHIDGIESVERDHEFDDVKYRSGGIRLRYRSLTEPVEGIKEGILLELGFDDTTPNMQKDISSWAYDRAVQMGVEVVNNTAKNIACYHPGHTFVEKLQTVSTKYRKERETGEFPKNFMRHYYDIFCLLRQPEVLDFIGTDEYKAHKERRFRGADNPVISENEAFLLADAGVRARYAEAYKEIAPLCYGAYPPFEEVMESIYSFIGRL